MTRLPCPRPPAIFGPAIFGLAAGAICAASPARAADEEIQVYLDDINAPHQPGLELHVNDVVSGDGAPDYAGAQPAVHRLRVTPEWSYALDTHFELGAYLPLTTLDRSGRFSVDGWKVRVKWLAAHPERGFFYGINYEVGRVDHKLDQNPWNNEVKLIGGWNGARWIIGANANFDFALSGPAKGPASVEWATKVGYRLGKDTVLGVESYNGLGTLRRFGRPADADQATYLALDARLGRWELNAGLGKGYGTNRDDVIAKVIIGVPIGR